MPQLFLPINEKFWEDLKFEVQNLKRFKKIANIEKRVVFFRK